MAGATLLGVFNKALRHLEERKLKSLSENREPLRALQDEWSDAVEFILSKGFWNCAVRLVQITNDTLLTPQFGFSFAFTKPGDWVRTFQVSDNEGFDPLLREFADQNNVWYSHISPMYVKYVSNDSNFGLNMGLWTPGFVEYLGCYLAWVCAPRLKQDAEKVGTIEKRLKKIKADALATDAMDLPPGKMPYGTWVQARAPRGSILPIGSPFGNDAGGTDGQLSTSTGQGILID